MAKILKIGQSEFVWGARTYLMAVINVTHDSFSGDGILSAAGVTPATIEYAIHKARAFEAQGADIIDIGGISTKPQHIYGETAPVTEQTELARVIPVIEALQKCLKIPISIDTARPAVATAALKSGAHIINDISSASGTALAQVAKNFNCPLVIPACSPANGDILASVTAELQAKIANATKIGVNRQNIIADPAIGYHKNKQQSIAIIKGLSQLRKTLNLPLLVGISRKKFTANTEQNADFKKRLGGSISAAVLSVAGGADIIRTHEIENHKTAMAMADAIIRK